MESRFSKTIRKKIEAFCYIVEEFEVFYLFIQDLLRTCYVPDIIPVGRNMEMVEDSVCPAWGRVVV